jgi:hypothetical protein
MAAPALKTVKIKKSWSWELEHLFIIDDAKFGWMAERQSAAI